MKIEIGKGKKMVYFYPENDSDKYLLGQLSIKFKIAVTHFTSIDTNSGSLNYLQCEKDILIDYLGNSFITK